MNDLIQRQFNDLYANSADFRIFVERMQKYSTDEIVRKYGLNTELISYCSGLLRKQEEVQAGV